MIPTLNAMMVVGIVSLPGMMTGQLLAVMLSFAALTVLSLLWLPYRVHRRGAIGRKSSASVRSLYGVLLDFRLPALYTQSTQTFGLRATGPYQFSKNWSALYAAEFAQYGG